MHIHVYNIIFLFNINIYYFTFMCTFMYVKYALNKICIPKVYIVHVCTHVPKVPCIVGIADNPDCLILSVFFWRMCFSFRFDPRLVTRTRHPYHHCTCSKSGEETCHERPLQRPFGQSHHFDVVVFW